MPLFTNANSCVEVLTPPYRKGHLVAETALQLIFEIGAGQEGGTVRRIIDKENRRSELEKEYYDEFLLMNDIAALEALSDLASGLQGVTIFKPLRRDDFNNKLYFQDVRGFNLEAVRNPSKQSELLRTFMKWGDEIMDRADARSDMEVIPLGTSIWIKWTIPQALRAQYGDKETADIMLKPDNVIFDTINNRLVIFDPF